VGDVIVVDLRCPSIASVFGVGVLLGDSAVVGRVPRFHVPERLEFEQLLGPPSLHLEVGDDALALVAVE